MIDFIYTVDYAVLNFIQNYIANPVLDVIMSLYTHLGDHGLFMIAVACVLMIFKKTRKIGITMGVALFIGTLTTNVVIKPLVGRIRPYDNSAWNPLLSAADLLIEAPDDPSFPSGHTTAAFETAVALLFYKKKWGIGALFAAAVLAFSRLYVYVHYLSDVLAGALIGTCAATAAFFIVKAVWGWASSRFPVLFPPDGGSLTEKEDKE